MCEELEKRETSSDQEPEEQTELTAAEETAGEPLASEGPPLENGSEEEQLGQPEGNPPEDEAGESQPEEESSLPDEKPGDEQPEEPMRKRGFVIKRRAAVEKDSILRAVSMEQFLAEHPGLLSARELATTRRPLLVISQRAEREIKDHIGWAMKTRYNIREQGGILIGSPYLVDGRVVSVVECAIPAELSESNAAYLKMDTETWVKMLNLYDERYRDQGLYVVGWFHTHPNGLGVFMSSTDMGTQWAFFRENWHFAIVLNPHRKLIACFHSAQADSCCLYPANFTDR